MLTLSITLFLATSPLPLSAPPMVSVEVAPAGRSARLLDAQSQAALAELDRRAASLEPSATEKTLRTLGIISLSVAAIPVVAAAVGLVVGIVVGAVAWGIVGAFAGMFVGVWAVLSFLPLPVWLGVAALGAAGGVFFTLAKVEGEANRAERRQIAAERRAILHLTPMSTIATF